MIKKTVEPRGILYFFTDAHIRGLVFASHFLLSGSADVALVFLKQSFFFTPPAIRGARQRWTPAYMPCLFPFSFAGAQRIISADSLIRDVDHHAEPIARSYGPAN